MAALTAAFATHPLLASHVMRRAPRAVVESGARSAGRERILRAAITLFRNRGYHGTSVRDLAEAAGIETASLYYHFSSKQAILAELFDRIMDDLLEGIERALASRDTPQARLREMVRFHVLVHVVRQDEAYISHAELRSLDPANRRRIVARRDRYEQMLRDLLEAGRRAGCFRIADVPVTSTAILVMCSGVSDWFSEVGRLSPERLVERYADLVLQLVGVPASAARSAPRRDPRPTAARARGTTVAG